MGVFEIPTSSPERGEVKPNTNLLTLVRFKAEKIFFKITNVFCLIIIQQESIVWNKKKLSCFYTYIT